MIIYNITFYFFAIFMLVSALMVITVRNPVNSVLFLILTFFNAAALFILRGAEFLAMSLVIVYVGAVAVLFLFVVMMLDIQIHEVKRKLGRYFLIGARAGRGAICRIADCHFSAITVFIKRPMRFLLAIILKRLGFCFIVNMFICLRRLA